MLALLSTGLLVAVALALPATLLVFTVPAERRSGVTTSALGAAVAGVTVGLAALGLGALLDSGPLHALVAALVLGASVPAWVRVAAEWDLRGLVAWALSLDAGLLYLAYVVVWMSEAGLGLGGLVASLLLLTLEVFVFLIGIGHLWEFVDVLARRTWTDYVETSRARGSSVRPFVSIHVPTHNEPPELVIETLESLLALEYDAYEILLVDNNTRDPELWQPVEAFCALQDRITFLHLEDWPGFKSGALNYALTRVDPRTEVVGIVDADYLVKPDFLSRCAPLFADQDVAFVQTPQDYRGWEGAAYFRRLYYSYGYFFDVSQRSRNERNGAIFGGTMGLIRLSALTGVGGWDEWCITEDAELSLRLLRAGDRGVHVQESYGRGVMPLTFEALKRQRFRWCFGGIQILRMHWRSLMPGRRTEENRLSLAQRWAYLVGGLQWFGDLASVLFTVFLLAGALTALSDGGLVIRRLSGFLVVCIVALLVLGLGRALALIRRTSGATWSQALGAFGLWVALGWTVSGAASRGLFAREGVFLRTPKVRGELGVMDAVRGNLVEIGLALLCAAVGVVAVAHSVGTAWVGALLLVQGAGFAAAPANSLAAIRSDLPEELRRRRRVLVRLQSLGRPARRGGLVLTGGALALGAFIVFAAPVGGPELGKLPHDLVEQARPSQDHTSPTPSSPGPSHRTESVSAALATRTASQAITTPATQASTVTPSQVATTHPTGAPTTHPTQAPTTHPTGAPTTHPTQAPTTHPTGAPTTHPTQAPTTHPTQAPTSHPTATTTAKPTAKPTRAPTSHPTATQPTKVPTTHATGRPSSAPTARSTSSPWTGGVQLS